ncbi:MAG: hypothetical protein U0169_04775 [Polyangiaceae bacterium]
MDLVPALPGQSAPIHVVADGPNFLVSWNERVGSSDVQFVRQVDATGAPTVGTAHTMTGRFEAPPAIGPPIAPS